MLRNALQELNQKQLDSYFRQNKIEWKFNSPSASHLRGAWERSVRSIRCILSALVNKGQTLTDDSLETLLIKVEKILNSRPLITPLVIDPTAEEPITPSHLLLAYPSENLSPGLFSPKDVYACRHWKQVQHLTNVFWKRWLREYLPTIALRSKWPDHVRNFPPNNLVLVVIENVPCGKWRMACFISTCSDRYDDVRMVEVKTQTRIIQRPIPITNLAAIHFNCTDEIWKIETVALSAIVYYDSVEWFYAHAL